MDLKKVLPDFRHLAISFFLKSQIIEFADLMANLLICDEIENFMTSEVPRGRDKVQCHKKKSGPEKA